MRKSVLMAAAALTLAAGSAQAAVTLTFTITTDSYYISNYGALAGSFQLSLPYFPTYNADFSGSQITSCSLTRSGAASNCDAITLYADTAPLISTGHDIYDGILVAGAYFYFANGAFSSPGGYDSVHMSVDTATLLIIGTADGPQPVPPPLSDTPGGLNPFPSSAGVPEPYTWSLMISGLFGVGAVLRRAKTRHRIAQTS